MNKIIQALIISLLPLISIGALTVNNGGGATNITSTSAWITATVVSTGAANPYLYSYWGTNSGGTNATSWGHTNAYGVCTQGSYSAQITGLSGSTIYYFRTRGTNASEMNWATYSAQFITLTTPTSAPPSTTQAVTVDINDVLKHPTNLFVANTGLLAKAIGTFSVTNIPFGITTFSAYRGDWGDNISGRVEVLEGKTSLWDKASTDAITATQQVTVIQLSTSLWNKASTDAVTATNALPKIDVLESSTSLWNKASVDGVSATSAVGVIQSSTSLWNKAATDGVTATNALQVLQGATNALNANKLDLSGGIMTGPLTNNSGFFGDGGGLTNLPVSGGGDVYASSNNPWSSSVTQNIPNVSATMIEITTVPGTMARYIQQEGSSMKFFSIDGTAGFRWNVGTNLYANQMILRDSSLAITVPINGNGSGLTNVPLPSGVVTNPVGANINANGYAITNLNYCQTTGATTKVVFYVAGNGTTNITPLVISTVGFQPKGVQVTASIWPGSTIVEGPVMSWGFVDSDGTQKGISTYNKTTYAGVYSFTAAARLYWYTTEDSEHILTWSSWNNDGATFTRSITGNPTTNDVTYLFYFYR